MRVSERQHSMINEAKSYAISLRQCRDYQDCERKIWFYLEQNDGTGNE
jgi:hypothetical protein